MRPAKEVGIVGYGGYIPRYRISAAEVARVWCDGEKALSVKEKAVAGPDEDATTIAIEAARNALASAQVDPQRIRAIWVGSESKPYAVKPSGSIVAEAIGAVPEVLAADWEFACKAGTEAMQAAMALIGSGMAEYAFAIGADTAQGGPGDALEYTTGAGGAAYLLGPGQESLAYIEASSSYVSDLPDFFRRPSQAYPRHGHRFTGLPAYFKHSAEAAKRLMGELGYAAEDFQLAVFHQPNVKYPLRLAKMLGFEPEQVEPGMLVAEIGNAYAASSLLGLAAALDVAEAGDRILLVSFGSGAGSDTFSLVVTAAISERRGRTPSIRDYVRRRREIDYATYVRFRKKLRMS